MSEPIIQYARSQDGVSIAYFQLGQGPHIVFASNTFGDVHHYNLPHPHTRRMTDELVERGWSVVRCDLRGMGSSDRNVTDMSLAAQTLDLEAVIARLELGPFALAGVDEGAAVAMNYAARHPLQVSQLILLNPFASGKRRLEQSPALRALASVQVMADHDWTFILLMAGTLVTLFSNPDHARELAAGFQLSTSPKTWKANFDAQTDIDLTPLLPLIQIPTLVVHYTGFPFGSFESCQEVASGIADSRLVVIPGDGGAEIAAIDNFLRPAYGPRLQISSNRLGHLTSRQREVLDLVARGKTNKEIAEDLVLSLRTVERHIADIYTKIGVRHRSEAVAYALNEPHSASH